ncbi:cullin 3 [Trichuris trichiura]|uniref:Cullin 3 n=1 Tax=Trichuris trichiura TaxID=36087 RepID=A0A077YWV0_TRITR|nr:cullin 3 [Trichuris trichiura]
MNMDESYVQSTWELLRCAIQMIQNQNNSVLSFEELYRNAYTMVLHKHGDKLYNGLREVVMEHLVRVDVLNALNNDLLEVLNKAWHDHTTSMVMIRDILMYMDRVYVQQHCVESVYNLGLILFRDEVIRYEGIREHLTEDLLKMVAAKRQGYAVNLVNLKTACQMLMALGVNSRTVYEEDFEVPFLLRSAEFFQRESNAYLSEENASVYIRKVNQRIIEESYFAKHYMDSKTECKVISVLEAEMISKHMNAVVEMESSGLVSMLKDNRFDDLNCMYRLLLRVEEGLNVLTTTLSGYLRAQGRSRVQELKDDKLVTPVKFIQNLIDLKDDCDRFLKEAFESNCEISKIISSDFAYFLNLDNRAPEYLSLFIDDRLRRGSKAMNDTELESIIDKAMVLFRLLQDKDIFERYYKQHLGKRLLNSRTVSDDAEKSVISKLRTECGCQFTNKIEGMFKDVQLSATFMKLYREEREKGPSSSSEVEISASILTTGFWPTTNPSPNCIIPRAVETTFEKLKTLYLNNHSGRSITLQPHLGTVDINAYFYPRGNDHFDATGSQVQCQKHILCVSTYQMCVLMLFNRKACLTYKQIESETGIVERDLKRTLLSLTAGKPKQRVLCRLPTVDDPSKRIGAEDKFWVNDSFSSRLHRVKIPTLSSRMDQEPEEQEMRQKIDDQRRLEVEAAIVRIMKARKSLRHDALITEVIGQLKGRFVPFPGMIKMRIESLIDRDYLSRDAKDHKVYRYVA